MMGKLLLLCIVINCVVVGLCADLPQCFRLKMGEVSCKESIGLNTVVKTVASQGDCFSKNDGAELLKLVQKQSRLITGMADHFNKMSEKEKERLLREQELKAAAERERLLEEERKKAEAEKAASMSKGTSCRDILVRVPTATDGVYTIAAAGKSFKAYCDMSGGGWIVFQRRFDGSTSFHHDYKTYAKGFGNVEGEYWLGLDHMNELTKTGEWELMVDMEDYFNAKAWARYFDVNFGDAKSGYVLNYGSFLGGNAGDALGTSKGRKFTTYDVDQDLWHENCAVRYTGAWWYNACHYANLNAWVYGRAEKGWAKGMCWVQFKGWTNYMKKTMMKIRPMGILQTKTAN